MAARLGSQYAKAILDIMVRDALDEPGKSFLRPILGRVFHTLTAAMRGQMLQRASAQQLVCFASPR
jgi:hypothetical protein